MRRSASFHRSVRSYAPRECVDTAFESSGHTTQLVLTPHSSLGGGGFTVPQACRNRIACPSCGAEECGYEEACQLRTTLWALAVAFVSPARDAGRACAGQESRRQHRDLAISPLTGGGSSAQRVTAACFRSRASPTTSRPGNVGVKAAYNYTGLGKEKNRHAAGHQRRAHQTSRCFQPTGHMHDVTFRRSCSSRR